MIRPFAPADLEAVVEIANLGWREIYRMFRRTYGDELFALVVPDEATCKGEQVRGQCQRSPEGVLVAEQDGRVVGFATFRMDPQAGAGEIGNNAVHPDVKGKGVAQQLYAAILDRCRAAGLRYARVHTGLDEAHGPARRAYERAGFGIRHEEVTYFTLL